MKLFKTNFYIVYAHLENTSGDMPMTSDLQLVYMVPRNSIQLLNINTTKLEWSASQSRKHTNTVKVVVFLQKKCIYECVAKPHAVHGKGVLGYAAPTKNFEKWYVLMYILIRFFLKTFEKLTFSYKNNDFTWSLAIEY